MNTYDQSGTPCDPSSDWPETPPANLERLLAASVYLAEAGDDMSGSLEDVTYRLVVELAKVRQANTEMYRTLSNEVERYRARWKFERELANDALESCDELEEQLETADFVAGENLKAYTLAVDNAENFKAVIDQLAPYIDWDGVFSNG